MAPLRSRALFGFAAVAIAVGAFLGLRSGPEPVRGVDTVALDSAAVAGALAQRATALRAAQAVGSGDLGPLLAQDPVDLALPAVTRQGVTLRDVSVRRDGAEAAAEATVDPGQLATLAPAEVADLRYDPEASRAGGLALTGSAGAFGLSLPVTIRVTARDGEVVAVPEGLPVGAQVLFSDPRVRVRRIVSRPVPGGVRVRVEAAVG